MDSFKAKKISTILLTVLIVCLIIGLAYQLLKSLNNVKADTVFVINGKDYSKSEVQQLTLYPVKVVGYSQNQAAQEVFTAEKDITAAQKLGYIPPQNAITIQKNKIYHTLKLNSKEKSQYDSWFTLLATQDAVDTFVMSRVPLGYAGYSYVFFFGQHLQSVPGYSISGFNNPKLIAQDQAYAKQKANFYHQELQDNKISLNQALQQSIRDMQTRGHGPNNPNFSTNFTTLAEQNWASAVYFPDIVNYITTLRSTGLSAVQVGKASTGSKGNEVDMYYYFVNLSAVPTARTISYQEFNKTLSSLKTTYIGYQK
jgi:uncharacterized protein YxeA